MYSKRLPPPFPLPRDVRATLRPQLRLAGVPEGSRETGSIHAVSWEGCRPYSVATLWLPNSLSLTNRSFSPPPHAFPPLRLSALVYMRTREQPSRRRSGESSVEAGVAEVELNATQWLLPSITRCTGRQDAADSCSPWHCNPEQRVQPYETKTPSPRENASWDQLHAVADTACLRSS